MFYLRNFKNFAEAELDSDQSATLLVGPNGSGKSNLIEAVELLSFLAAGHRLYEVTDIGREGQLEVRGGLESCAKAGLGEFTLGFNALLPVRDSAAPSEVRYKITVRVKPEPRISSEVLSITGRDIPLFEILSPDTESASADNRVRYDNYARGGNKPVESIAADRSALSQYAKFAHSNDELRSCLAVVEAVVSALAPPRVFDPIPKLMRGYERGTDTQLARNGYNISPVLFSLSAEGMELEKGPGGRASQTLASRKEALRRILARLRQLPDEPFAEFDFIRMPRMSDVMFGLKAAGSDELVDARLLSDGTLRALAILTALETAQAGSRLILEEFDNGVHPSRVQVMSEALFDCATRNRLHVIATTHNPATMNALTAEQLDLVLLLVSGAASNTARLVKLRDLPGSVEFVERGRLGDLVTRRIYEEHLRPDYEKERRKGIEDWVNALP
jgi:predicted ATPase